MLAGQPLHPLSYTQSAFSNPQKYRDKRDIWAYLLLLFLCVCVFVGEGAGFCNYPGNAVGMGGQMVGVDCHVSQLAIPKVLMWESVLITPNPVVN